MFLLKININFKVYLDIRNMYNIYSYFQTTEVNYFVFLKTEESVRLSQSLGMWFNLLWGIRKRMISVWTLTVYNRRQYLCQTTVSQGITFEGDFPVTTFFCNIFMIIIRK